MDPNVVPGNNGSDSPFPIVGIGASAGGLYSLECFLLALPKEFGFAMVFIQHLSAIHRSLLPELLNKQLPHLKIHEIAEGLKILPGRLYLCTPGKDFLIREGTFHEAPRTEGHVHLPIDEFFSSLAEEAPERAIAVIFSGAGTDGARGVQAVRTAGGTVFVQEPSTAEFSGMPLAAIGTGQVDGILPPDEIAREIVKLQTPGQASSAADTLITPEQFETICRLIHESTGYRFNHYKKSVVGRRIRRRMYLSGVASLQDYTEMIAARETEAALLAADLMIGVTSFFRDRLAWRALKREVVRNLAAVDDDAPVRVWTPACATGEEAYSIAMLLSDEFELAGRRREIQVFATDVNDRALDKAREGTYPGSIAADVPAGYIRKFFTAADNGISVTINKEIRERVVFARQDLLSDPPFSHLDLVICRNLLIYLEPAAQEKCVGLFHYALKEGGYLFLGNAESVGRNSMLFKSLGHKKCRVYRKIGSSSSRMPLPVPFDPERVASSLSKPAAAEYRQPVTEFIQERMLDEYAPAAVAINQHYEILYHNGDTNRYLRQPRGTPTRNLLDLLPKNLHSKLRGAIYRATQKAGPVSVRTTIAGEDEKKRQATFRVSRLRENLFLVTFREKGGRPEPDGPAADEGCAVEETAVRQLETELSATRAELQSNVEQLKSLNEELQSSNEELQAANEELETSREELQSLNEELIIVNSQLQGKIEEQEETNNDLNNFLFSTNIPTIFLGHRLTVKRFTPAMSRLIKLIPSDAGRPISDMSQELLGPDLVPDAQSVLETLVPVKKEMTINGTWYVRATLPYRTSDNRIEGVVVTYTDISELKQAEERTRHLASFPELNPNPVLEVDASGNVIFANPATRRILEALGMDGEDVALFLPQDLDDILRDWDRKNERTLYREISIKDIFFGAALHLVPRFNAVRIYAFDITERKRSEEVKGRLSAIVDSADDAIISQDLNGVIRTWNVGAEKIFGYTAGEVVGRPIFLLVPPGHVDEVPDILRRISQGEHIEHFETVRMRKDGTVIPVSLTFSPIKDASGAVVGASKIAHDTSERNRMEVAFRHAAEQRRLSLEAAELGAWDYNFETGDVFWDERCRNMFGVSTGDQIDYDEAIARIHTEDRAATDEAVKKAIAGADDGAYHREFRVVWPDGQVHWVASHGRVYFEGEGERLRAVRFIGVNMDITGRKRAEEALRESEERERMRAAELDRLLSVAPLPIWVAQDAQCHVVTGNLAAAQLLGVTKDLNVSQTPGPGESAPPIRHLRNGRELAPEELPLQFAVSHGREVSGIELDMVLPDGKIRHLVGGAAPLFDNAGNVCGGIAAYSDVTELKSAQDEINALNEELQHKVAELEAVNEDLESFIYSVSHDLRAPLRSMSGFAKIVEDEYAGRLDAQAKDFLGRIRLGAGKMSQLIDGLLHLSRISRQVIGRAQIDMSKAAAAVIADLRQVWPDRTVDVDIQEGITGSADPRLIEIALSNLLGNAWKFTSRTDGARIRFGAVDKEGKTVYYVSDNGAGFDPEYANQMFRPFHRLHSDAEFEGTGIGLAIVERVIHRHGGKVWAESGTGKGATIYFTLD
jgi:two-component system CheB/CheR fusion protein